MQFKDSFELSLSLLLLLLLPIQVGWLRILSSFSYVNWIDFFLSLFDRKFHSLEENQFNVKWGFSMLRPRPSFILVFLLRSSPFSPTRGPKKKRKYLCRRPFNIIGFGLVIICVSWLSIIVRLREKRRRDLLSHNGNRKTRKEKIFLHMMKRLSFSVAKRNW